MLRAIQAVLDGPIGAELEAEVRGVQSQLRQLPDDRRVRQGAARQEGSSVRDAAEPSNIAGMCLDPTGGWVYVSGENGIVEWRVREREEGKGGGAGGWV
jgi:hypothetical protein